MICQTGYFFYFKIIILTKISTQLFKNIDQNAFIGRKLIYLPSCHSTNDEALSLIKDDKYEHGKLIITSDQTKGRGQRGNQWLTKPGQNLTFSIILDVTFLNTERIFDLNMVVSLGILKGLNSTLNAQHSTLKVKWPNDIYFEEKKLGGILIENVFRGDGSVWSVAGIGININQEDFNYLNATSLRVIAGREFDLQAVLNGITNEIEKFFLMLKTDGSEKIKSK